MAVLLCFAGCSSEPSGTDQENESATGTATPPEYELIAQYQGHIADISATCDLSEKNAEKILERMYPEMPDEPSGRLRWSQPTATEAVANARAVCPKMRKLIRQMNNPESEPTPAPKPKPKPEPEPEPAPVYDSVDDIRWAIDDIGWTVETPKAREVRKAGSNLLITLVTPEGGFEGPSTRDMNEQAAAVFQAVYRDTDYSGPITVTFRGGLMDSRTGRSLPNAATGRYAVSQGEARQIPWGSNNKVRYAIDWSLYRVFVHPAIKMDD